MERSITFTDDELGDLVALCTSSPPDHLRVGRDRAAGRRSLRERHIVVEADTDGPQVALPVHALVQVLGHPAAKVVVHRGDGAGWDPHPLRLSLHGDAGVEHRVEGEPTDGEAVHRLTPFPAQDLLARVAQVTGLQDLRPPEGPAPSPASGEDGASTVWAVSVSAVERPGRRHGVELAWLSTPTGAWRIPPAATPLGGPTEGLPTTGVVAAEAEPVSGADLAQDLLASTEVLGGGSPSM